MDKSTHRRDNSRRAIRGFDCHRTADGPREREKHHECGVGRRAIGCFFSRRFYINPDAPHFRMTARTLALPGGHVREVRRPASAAHLKADGQ